MAVEWPEFRHLLAVPQDDLEAVLVRDRFMKLFLVCVVVVTFQHDSAFLASKPWNRKRLAGVQAKVILRHFAKSGHLHSYPPFSVGR